MSSRLSLANKCLVIFGCAIVVIIASTLSILWDRSSQLVHDYQIEVAQQLSDLWIHSKVDLSGGFEDDGVSIELIYVSSIETGDATFEERARNTFMQLDTLTSGEFFVEKNDDSEQNYFQYARPITASQLKTILQEGVTNFKSGVSDPALSDSIDAILVVRRKTKFAQTQIEAVKANIVFAGIVGSLLAALIFFVILKRLILSPVRRLRRVSEKVQQGDLTARSSLKTGDEFEELSDAFNEMLDRLQSNQSQLEKMNESLDLKVEELAEVNIGLFESGKLKNEFIANVSHELRTPLNSIIGFAEILEGMDIDSEEDIAKRLRYLQNILTSGRALLDMINELLDMAKIEAGRMEVNLEPTSISDVLEGLSGIMRPQAKSKNITLTLAIASTMPTVLTDPGKLQQILYNFLSNAIKFTPQDSEVIIRSQLLHANTQQQSVKLSIQDNGPGIPEDMLDMVFEKFRQVDATHTREHAGTGLGLAICRELSELLHGTLSVQSAPGEGATFAVELPITFASETPKPLMPS
jgi:signal transduction histidine kinase